MRLWILLTVIVNSLVLLAFATFGAFSAHFASEHLTEHTRSNANALAISIASGSANDLLTSSFDRIENRIVHQIVIGNTAEVVVADAEGRIVSQVRRTPQGTAQILPINPSTRIENSRTTFIDADSLTQVLPVERGELLGWVQVRSSLMDLPAAKRKIWLSTMVASLLTATVLSLALAALMLRVSHQIGLASRFAAELIHQRNLRIQLTSPIWEEQQLFNALNQVSTELSEQHQSLQNIEARKSAMLQASLDCLITLDDEGRIVDFNPASERTFGYERSEVLGVPMVDIIVPPEHRRGHTQGMARLRQTGTSNMLNRRLEVSAMHRDTRIFPVELTIVPFVSSGKNYYLGSFRDLSDTKRLQADQARAIAELELRQFALDQHAIVSITDLEGTIVFANDKLCEISQYERDELIGMNQFILATGDHDSAIHDQIFSIISAGKVWHGTVCNRSKNGSMYWVKTTIVPLKGPDGLPNRHISISTDVSHQKRTEQELNDNQVILENLIKKYRVTETELHDSRTREMEVGSLIQKNLLFGAVPKLSPALRISAYTEPSKGIDGDFYDFWGHSDNMLDILIGDVMGKGVAAALVGAAIKQQFHRVTTRMAFRNDQRLIHRPSELVNEVHQDVTHRLVSLDTFLTLAYARIDLDRKCINYVDAGHTRSLLLGPSGTRWLTSDNLPIGTLESEHYVQHEVPVVSGDLLFLYSDGFTEARSPDGDEFGVDRLVARLEALHTAEIPAQIMVQALRQDVLEFEHYSSPTDDRTCIAVQFLHEEPPAHAAQELELAWQLEALQPLRERVHQAALSAGLPEEDADGLVLAAFEVATNVVRHAECPLQDATLHCRIVANATHLRLTFHYLGAPFPESINDTERLPDFSGNSQGGFGLFIIRSLVDQVIYDSPSRGTCRVRLFKNLSLATES